MLIKIIKYLYTLKYIKLIAYNSARHLQLKLNQQHKQKYLYYYGFQILYGSINKGLLLLLVGLALHILPEILITTLTFASLRVFVGGLHFDSYTRCAWTSLGTLTLFGLLSALTNYNPIINLIVFSTLFVIILIYAPVEHPNRPLNEKEKIKFKYIAFFILFILFAVQMGLNSIVFKNSILFGVLLAGIIALPFVNRKSNIRK